MGGEYIKQNQYDIGEKKNYIQIEECQVDVHQGFLKGPLSVGMACQKVYKQGRDDIIVKVHLQSLIPTPFSH